jgi:hypothetical protein
MPCDLGGNSNPSRGMSGSLTGAAYCSQTRCLQFVSSCIVIRALECLVRVGDAIGRNDLLGGEACMPPTSILGQKR